MRITTITAKAAQQVVGSFGRLWSRGHETLETTHGILSVAGTGATMFLQGLVTCDLTQPPTPPRPEPTMEDQHPSGLPKHVQRNTPETKQDPTPMVSFGDQLRAACFLDHKGRILTDSLLWKVSEQQYYIDCPLSTVDLLLKHLKQHKLRKTPVTIAQESSLHSSVIFGTLQAQGAPPGYLAALDPRHPSLGLRVLKLPTATTDLSTILKSSPFPSSPGNYEFVRRLAGVAEGSELTGKVAIESNQEFLQAVSFQKGCYLGQELTARVHHTGVVRKRILPLLLTDTRTEIPHIWNVASQLQQVKNWNTKKTKEEQQKQSTFADSVGDGALLGRLPRLSVLSAGNLVAIMTGAALEQNEEEQNGSSNSGTIKDDEAAQAELARARDKAAHLVESIQSCCKVGAKLVDVPTGTTVGQIVSPPLPGTNVVLAMMRLESVGLLLLNNSNNTGGDGTYWSKTNKIVIGEHDHDGGEGETAGPPQLRYLPYLPLWWPQKLDYKTGKAHVQDEDEDEDENEEGEVEEDDDEERQDESTLKGADRRPHFSRIEIEELPISSSLPSEQVATTPSKH